MGLTTSYQSVADGQWLGEPAEIAEHTADLQAGLDWLGLNGGLIVFGAPAGEAEALKKTPWAEVVSPELVRVRFATLEGVTRADFIDAVQRTPAGKGWNEELEAAIGGHFLTLKAAYARAATNGHGLGIRTR
jgi:hypothetical protein